MVSTANMEMEVLTKKTKWEKQVISNSKLMMKEHLIKEVMVNNNNLEALVSWSQLPTSTIISLQEVKKIDRIKMQQLIWVWHYLETVWSIIIIKKKFNRLILVLQI